MSHYPQNVASFKAPSLTLVDYAKSRQNRTVERMAFRSALQSHSMLVSYPSSCLRFVRCFNMIPAPISTSPSVWSDTLRRVCCEGVILPGRRLHSKARSVSVPSGPSEFIEEVRVRVKTKQSHGMPLALGLADIISRLPGPAGVYQISPSSRG